MGDENNAGNGGTGQPDGSKPNSGTGNDGKPEFLTKAEFGGTAAMISRMNKSLEGLLSGQVSLDKLAELGLLEKAEDGSFKPKPAAAPAQQQQKPPKGEEDNPLIGRVKALESQLSEAKKREDEGKLREVQQELNKSVSAALGKAGAINADRDFVHLASKVKKDDKGYYVDGKDKYDVEIRIPLDEAADQFLKSNPELAKAKAAAGSGSPSGAGSGTGYTGNGKVIPKAQWGDMTWMAANHAKFLSGEYVRGT